MVCAQVMGNHVAVTIGAAQSFLELNVFKPRARGISCPAMSVLIKRSFTLAGHRTSVALELEFWQALTAAAAHGGRTLSALVAEIDAERGAERPLASALRVYALVWSG